MENTPPFDFPTLIDAPQSEAEIAVLPPATRAVIALKSSKTEFDMRAMVAKHAGLVEIKDKAGREQVHGAAMELMRARTAVKKVADETRDDAKKFNAAVIAEEKRLAAIVEGEETRLKALRDAWDAEQENIKREAEKRDRERILSITERIAAIRSTGSRAGACRTSERVAAIRDSLEATDMTEFDEFEAEAVAAFEGAKLTVATILTNKLADEEAAAKEKADREAEAQRLAEEQEKVAAAQKKLDDERAELERMKADFAAAQAAIPAVVNPEKQDLADAVREIAGVGIAIADDMLHEKALAAATTTGLGVIANGQVLDATQVFKQPTYCCETGEALGMDGVACPQCSETSAAYSAAMSPSGADALAYGLIGADMASGPDVHTFVEVKFAPGDPSTHAAQVAGYSLLTGVTPSLPIDLAQADATQDPTDEELMTVVIDAVSGYFGMSEQEAMSRLSAIKTWLYEGSPLAA